MVEVGTRQHQREEVNSETRPSGCIYSSIPATFLFFFLFFIITPYQPLMFGKDRREYTQHIPSIASLLVSPFLFISFMGVYWRFHEMAKERNRFLNCLSYSFLLNLYFLLPRSKPLVEFLLFHPFVVWQTYSPESLTHPTAL